MAFRVLQRLRWISLAAVVLMLASEGPSTIRQNSPVDSLERAKHLAWLDNWAEASRVLDRLNPSGRFGDEATAVFAKAVEVRGNIESLSLPAAARELSRLVATEAAQNDPQLRLQILAMRGDVEFQYDLPTAERTWSEVAQLATATGQDTWEVRSGGELGCIAFLNGEVYTAMKKVVAAYFRAEVSGDVAEKMKTLTALGEGLAEFGRPADALRFFNRVLALSAENPDAYFPFTAYLGKARLLLESNPAVGRRMLLDGLDTARRENLRVREARILIVLGDNAARLGDRDGAVRWLRAAVQCSRDGGLHRVEAEAGSKLASALSSGGQLNEASLYARNSVTAAERSGDVYHLPQDLAALGEVDAMRGELAAAEGAYQQATRLVDSLFSDLPSVRHESTIVATMGRVFRGYIDLALNRLHDPNKAFQILEAAHARGLVDRIRQNQLAIQNEEHHDPTMLKKVAVLNRLLVSEQKLGDRSRLLDRLWETELRSIRFPDQRRQAPHMPTESAADLQQVQSRLSDGELLIEYALEQPQSFAFAITRDQAVPYFLAGRNEIESAITRQVRAIQANRDAKAEGRAVYALLFKPIGVLGKCSRLIIVPDGKMNTAPLSAAVEPDGHYLIESRVLSFAPSATVYYLLSTRRAPLRKPVEALGVGGAVYSPMPVLSAAVDSVRGGLFNPLAPPHFSNLSRSTAEVANLASAGNWDTHSLTGENATEGLLKRLPLSSFDVLHFALHSAIDREFPDRSGLVLTARSGDQEDDLLQAREIMGLKLNAELVTLSSCDGAAGTPEGMAGTNSLVQAFLMAGARSVVASVWQADDAFTAALMRRFYTNLHDGFAKADALTAAKRELLREWGPNALPVYWAGFRIVGDPNGTL